MCLLELRPVLHGVSLECRGVFEDGLDPLGIFFEEYGSATWIERCPHERIMAETEDEEVAGSESLEYVEGDGDFSQ